MAYELKNPKVRHGGNWMVCIVYTQASPRCRYYYAIFASQDEMWSLRI